jgi:hypothetical protein
VEITPRDMAVVNHILAAVSHTPAAVSNILAALDIRLRPRQRILDSPTLIPAILQLQVTTQVQQLLVWPAFPRPLPYLAMKSGEEDPAPQLPDMTPAAIQAPGVLVPVVEEQAEDMT